MATDPLPEWLSDAIGAFREHFHECSDGELVRDLCADVAMCFVGWVNRGEVVWFDDALTERSHAVALVEGRLIDFSYRQFDPECDVPVIWEKPPWGQLVDEDGRRISLGTR